MTSQSVVVPNVAPSAVVPTAVVQTAVATTQPGQHPMASLYVGDLHPTATEAMLYTKFSEVGPVLSIRVCRDAITRRSLGYAYVNFQQSADAERAITNMNFDQLNGKPIRIMWSQRDPTVRRSNNGNIFIKNLDQSIDTKSIYDTFSMFGKILSCKVACDDEGKSKGYGFIHFEREEDALKAIEKVDGMLLDQKPVTVCKFQPRAVRLREMGDAAHRFTNVYVKNFADHLKDDDALKKLFGKFGTITSAVVIKDADGKSRGFGFVCFETHDEAVKAVEEMNDHVLPDTDLKLTVCRAQKKSERQAELARIYEQYKIERLQKYRGTNLYVKNLDDSIDDAELKRNFEQYGKINSAKVMVDPNNGCSKGFGFVGYESADDASRALAEMNSKILKNKPLYVALAQRKEERRAQLAQQYMQRVANMRQNQAGGIPRYNTGMGNAGFNMPGYASVQPHQNFIGRPPMVQNYQQIPQNSHGQHMGQRRQQNNYNYGFGRGTGANRSFMPNHGGPRRPSFNQSKMVHGGRASRYGSIQHANMAASTNPQEQKQAIGEQLYKLIGNMTNDPNVGKITGMLLEMDNKDLMTLLGDKELLRDRVREANNVLQHATAKRV